MTEYIVCHHIEEQIESKSFMNEDEAINYAKKLTEKYVKDNIEVDTEIDGFWKTIWTNWCGYV